METPVMVDLMERERCCCDCCGSAFQFRGTFVSAGLACWLPVPRSF